MLVGFVEIGSVYDARPTTAFAQVDQRSQLSTTRVENLCWIACAA